MFFLDDSTGWMVTEKGIWQTVESGRTWTKMRAAPSGLLRIWFLDKKHGFAAGLEKRVFETLNGGDTWTPLAIAAEAQGDPTYTTYGEIAFTGNGGIISGWNVPPRPGGPDWMEPERAAKRRQLPNLTVLLQTLDAGKTWKKSEASVFGQVTRISMAPQGVALGLVEYKRRIQVSERGLPHQYRHEWRQRQRVQAEGQGDYRRADVRRCERGPDCRLRNGAQPLPQSDSVKNWKVLTSDDLENWREMTVDYRAVAHRALIAGPDENHLWIATDTGTILKLVTE